MKSLRLILILFFPYIAFGQDFGERPGWVDGYYYHAKNSDIQSVFSFGYDIKSAKEAAIREALMLKGIATTGIEGSIKISEYGEVAVAANKDYIRVKCRVVDNYVERTTNGYNVWLLVQTARNPEYDYESVMITDTYPFSARVFVPGMAQIYKGQVGKGVGFIVGEVAFIGGIVASECLRASYVSKMNATRNVNQRQIYADNANICALSRNISIAGAAALYVWNIIDGAVAKGRKHVQIGDACLQFAPYAAPDARGLAFCLTF